jgi:hypothetical protein
MLKQKLLNSMFYTIIKEDMDVSIDKEFATL